MGTWNVGPFDNDSAADWCGDLNDAAAEKRPALIRDTLAVVAGHEGYLDSYEAEKAVAAAAVVAAQREGTPITSAYAPDFLLEGGSVDIDDGLVALAVSALDRVVAEDSEWLEEWEGSGEALAVIAKLRGALMLSSG